MPAVGEAAPTILIVDDDPAVRDVLERALGTCGYEARAVSSSTECLALMDAGANFDLLVIDIMLARATPHGFALGRMARYRNPNQKLVYVSGSFDAIPNAELEAAEAPVLAKPVRVADLLETVRVVLTSV